MVRIIKILLIHPNIYSNLQLVKSLNAEKELHNQYLKQATASERSRFWKQFLLSVGFGISTFAQYAVFALAFYFSGILREKYGRNMKDILIVLFTLIFGVSGAGLANQAIGSVGPAKLAAKRYCSFPLLI